MLVDFISVDIDFFGRDERLVRMLFVVVEFFKLFLKVKLRVLDERRLCRSSVGRLFMCLGFRMR